MTDWLLGPGNANWVKNIIARIKILVQLGDVVNNLVPVKVSVSVS